MVNRRAAITPAPLPRSTNQFDGLWRDLIDRMQTTAQMYAPTMATILSISGGSIKVQIDDENTPRSVGIPRAKGVNYQVGDRVSVQQTRGGSWMVTGIIGDSTSDGRVGNAQLASGAVSSTNLDSSLYTTINNAVSKDYVDGKVSNLQSNIDQKAGLGQVTGDRQRLCAIESHLGMSQGPCQASQ